MGIKKRRLPVAVQPPLSYSFCYLFKTLTCSRRSFLRKLDSKRPKSSPVGKIMIQVERQKSCAGKIKPSALHGNFAKRKSKIDRMPSYLRADSGNIGRRIHVNDNVVALRMP